jgi:hypothetical protein
VNQPRALQFPAQAAYVLINRSLGHNPLGPNRGVDQFRSAEDPAGLAEKTFYESKLGWRQVQLPVIEESSVPKQIDAQTLEGEYGDLLVRSRVQGKDLLALKPNAKPQAGGLPIQKPISARRACR